MRSRAVQFVALLLLISSMAGADACAGSVEQSRTPGGVFVRNLLLQAAVEDSEPAATGLRGGELRGIGLTLQPVQSDVHTVRGAAAHAAMMHFVTGSGL